MQNTALEQSPTLQAPRMTGPTSEQMAPHTPALLEQLLQLGRIVALQELASGIAHELNQPIGAITMFAQAAQRMLNRPDPMMRSTSEVLEQIGQQALRAADGIRRIRCLLNGHPDGRVECDLAEVIQELLPVLNLLSQRRGTQLILSATPGLPRISIDRLRIQHVLLALFQNALEAPTGCGNVPDVQIGIAGDRYGVRISVQDHGTGVPASAREHLFYPFFTTKAQGTGLGLASCRAIVEAHEGSIGFENLPGGGACFWVQLPAAAPRNGEQRN
ncbi:HAMP domain-containing sensor histidine kinase [Povalibacter sp.]|uniref:sensor histidine kinase n=1 Tax=Povalibacter sp. TaxID=1962978 RepID=UPI002F40B703